MKLPAADPNSRAAGSLGYRCETNFYREFAYRIRARVPRCFLSVTDEANNGFTLLLEDLAPAQAGDQIAGCSVEEARAAAINVAGLHAPTWNSPAVRELDWSFRTSPRCRSSPRSYWQRHRAISRALPVDRDTASVLQRSPTSSSRGRPVDESRTRCCTATTGWTTCCSPRRTLSIR